MEKVTQDCRVERAAEIVSGPARPTPHVSGSYRWGPRWRHDLLNLRTICPESFFRATHEKWKLMTMLFLH